VAVELIFAYSRMSTPPPKQRNITNSNMQRQLDAALTKMPRNQELLENKVLIPFKIQNAPARTLPAVNKNWGGVSASPNNYSRIFGTTRKLRKSRKTKSRKSVKGKKSRL